MLFSFETPVKQAEIFDQKQDYLFTLAQCLSDQEYLRYVKNSGKLKILDNGANESSNVPGEELMKLASTIGANIVVIPDKQFDKETTALWFSQFIEKYGNFSAYYDFMAVPQGRNVSEMFDSLLYMVKDKRVSLIGLQFKFIRQEADFLMWIQMAINVVENYFHKRIHFLGFGRQDQLKYDVNTMDTSVPINYANAYRDLDLFEQGNTPHKAPKGIDVWKDNLKDEQISIAFSNIDKLKILASGKGKDIVKEYLGFGNR